MANGSPNLLLSAYTHLGCWKDTARRAVPQIEGSDPRIRGNYVRRGDAINKCYQVARQRKMIIFAVQNGGWCAAAGNLNGYRKYGKAGNCKNGKGGPWANDVYRITNPIRPAVPKGIFTSYIYATSILIFVTSTMVSPFPYLSIPSDENDDGGMIHRCVSTCFCLSFFQCVNLFVRTRW